MSKHSVADAKNNLPKLINRALKGEPVVITRHGEDVVRLMPVSKAPRPISQAGIEWLEKHSIVPHGKAVGKLPWPNAGELIRAMRDEDWR
ncbi:MAG: type II toxin-antitoxin system Phd/YefM family antitoxin [Rhodospirillaceae bacterium]|nr:type II toxin-antitoxin system Phd/YefM family antitoxin [Rhodospirillaceae bacterium]